MTGSRHFLDSVPGLRVLSEQYGAVLHRDELTALGVTSRDIARQVAARRWRTVGEHVVILHCGGLDRRGELRCAVLHSGAGAALAAWTALDLHGLRRWERPEIHVVVRRGVLVRPLAGLVVHESRRYEPATDIVERAGIPTVPAARGAVDAAAWTSRADTAVALIAGVVQQRVARSADIADELHAAGMVRHRRHLLAHMAAIEAGAENLAEIRLGRLLRSAGLSPPRRQVWVTVAGGRRRLDAEVDLPDGTVLVIEVDGPDHDDLRIRAVDSVRDLSNAARGRATVRITPWALRHRRRELIAAFRELRGGSARLVSG